MSRLPQIEKFANWALSKANRTTSEVEFDGVKYLRIDSSFQGTLKKGMGRLREEMGKVSPSQRYYLINQGDHTRLIELGGTYKSEYSRFFVSDVRFVRV